MADPIDETGVETVEQFAQRIKSRYADYSEVPDLELARRIVTKFPEYRQRVDLPDVTPDEIAETAKSYGLRLTSAQRSAARNKAVGGSPRSYHLSGQAYDFAGDPKAMADFADHAKKVYGYSSPEIIHGNGDHKDHVHVAYRKARPSLSNTTTSAKKSQAQLDPAAFREWQAFEKDKEAGNLESAYKRLEGLKKFGFTGGQGDGGFPYITAPSAYQKAADDAQFKYLDDLTKQLAGSLQGKQIDPNSEEAQQLTQATRMRDDLMRKKRGEALPPAPPSTQSGRPAYSGPTGLNADLQYGATSFGKSLFQSLPLGMMRTGQKFASLMNPLVPNKETEGERELAEQVKATDQYMAEMAKAGTGGLGGSTLRSGASILAHLPAFYLLGGAGGGTAAETALFGTYGALEAAGQAERPNATQVATGAALNAIPIPFIKAAAKKSLPTRFGTGLGVGTAINLATGKPIQESLAEGALFGALGALGKEKAEKPPAIIGEPERASFREAPETVTPSTPVGGGSAPAGGAFDFTGGRPAGRRYQIVDREGKVLGDVPSLSEANSVIVREGSGKGWEIRQVDAPVEPRVVPERGPVRFEETRNEGAIERPSLIGEPGPRIQGPARRPQNIEPLDTSRSTPDMYDPVGRKVPGPEDVLSEPAKIEPGREVAAPQPPSAFEILDGNGKPLGQVKTEAEAAKILETEGAGKGWTSRPVPKKKGFWSDESGFISNEGAFTADDLAAGYRAVKEGIGAAREALPSFAMPSQGADFWGSVFKKPGAEPAAFTFKARYNTIFANPQGTKLLGEVGERALGTNPAPNGVNGLTFPTNQTRRMIRAADEMIAETTNPQKRAALEQLSGQMKSSVGSGPMIVQRSIPGSLFSGRAAARHERVHQSDMVMQEVAGGRLPVQRAVVNLPHMTAINSVLDRDPIYREMGAHSKAMEGAAYIASGEPGRFGLSEAQGVEFLAGYFDLIAKTYGPKWLETYGSMTGAYKEALQSAKQRAADQTGASRQAPRSSEGVPGGRTTGAGEVPRTEPSVAARTDARLSQDVKELFRGAGSLIKKPLDAVRWVDNHIRPVNQKIERQIVNSVDGITPEQAKPLISGNPEFKAIRDESLTRANELKGQLATTLEQVKGLTGTKQGILGLFSRPNPDLPELLIADRLARGVPADLVSLPEGKQAIALEIAEKSKALAQELTGIRQALGLPVRDVWLSGARSWYPALYNPKNPFSASMIGGKLYAAWKSVANPSRSEVKRIFSPRTSDRFSIVDQKGKLAEKPEGGFHLYDSRAEAEAAMSGLKSAKYEVEFFDKGEARRGNRKVAGFDSISERQKWIDENAGLDGSIEVIRTIDPKKRYQVLEPMTHEMSVAHGLTEDIFTNLQKGFGNEIETLKRVMILDKIGARMASDKPVDGYVSLRDSGFSIPADLIKSNPNIKRLAEGYVPKDLATSFVAFYGKNGPFARAYRAVENTYFRKFSTVYNFPFRHIKQLGENELALAFSHPEASLNLAARKRSLESFYEGAILKEKKDPIWQEFSNDPDMMNADMLHGDLKNIWGNLAADLSNSGSLSLMDNILASGGKIGDVLKQGKDGVEWLYGAEDQIYRFHLYKYLRENGKMSAAEAKQRVQDSFFDHLNLPPIVRMINRVVPFEATTTYNFARIFYKNFRDRPAESMIKTALLGMGYSYLRDQMMEMAGVKPEDLEKLGKNAPKFYEMILPHTNAKGENYTLNLSWLMPFGNMWQLFDTWKDRSFGEASHQNIRRLLPLSAQPLVTAISEKDAFGRDLVSDTERKTISGSEESRRIADAMSKQSLPVIMGQFWDKMYLRADEGEGRSQPWTQYLLSRTAGQINRLDIEGKQGMENALQEGRARALTEQGNAERSRAIRGDISEPALQERAGALEEKTHDDRLFDPLVLRAVDEVEKAEEGQPNREREAFDELMKSGKFLREEEAEDLVYDLVDKRQGLKELAKFPQGTYQAIEAAAQEEAEQGKVSKATLDRLDALIDDLAENDYNAVMDRFDRRVEEFRARMKRNAATR